MKQTFRTLIAALLISSIALLGTPSRVLASRSPLPPTQLTFTGSQIFRGILFGETPASQLFPEIWDSNIVAQTFDTTDKILAWNQFKESVVAQIIAADETFMDRFGVELQSGDQLRVQTALADASQRMSTAMQNLGYLDNNGNPQPDCEIFLVLGGAIAIVLALGLAGVGFSIVYYYYYHAVTVYQFRYYPPPERGPQVDSSLYEEMLVNSITDKLAVTQ